MALGLNGRKGKRIPVGEKHRTQWIELLERFKADTRALAVYLKMDYRSLMRRLHLNGIRLTPRWNWRTKADWDRVFAQHATLGACARAHGQDVGAFSRHVSGLGVEHPYHVWAAGDSLLGDMETEDLLELLRRHGGRRTLLAKTLGVSRTTLYREFQRRGI